MGEEKPSLRGAAASFVHGLFGTRQQVTYAVVGAYVFLLIKGAMMAQTSADIVALLNVAWLGVGVVLGAWFGDRMQERKTNGVSEKKEDA